MISKEAFDRRKTLQKEVVDHGRSLADERREWEDYAATLPLAYGVSVVTDIIEGVECLWITPEECIDDQVIMFAHGGGLVTGSVVTHRAFASEISRSTNRCILLVGYGLLPENDSNVPRDDFLAVYRNLLEVGRISPEKIAFLGDSNGAGVCVAAMVYLRDLGSLLPACVISISGAFDATLSGDTMHTRNHLDPVLSHEVLLQWQKLFSGVASLDAPEISPLFSNLDSLSPMLLLAGDHEVWLSDSVRLVQKMNEQGTPAELTVFEEMWHVWMTHIDLPESKQAMREISAFLDENLTR